MTRKQRGEFCFFVFVFCFFLDMEETSTEEWWNALIEDEREFSGKASGQCYSKKNIQKKILREQSHVFEDTSLDLRKQNPNETEILRYQNCQRNMPRGGRAISKYLCFEVTQNSNASPPFIHATSGKLKDVSQPRFLHLWNGGMDCTTFPKIDVGKKTQHKPHCFDQ